MMPLKYFCNVPFKNGGLNLYEFSRIIQWLPETMIFEISKNELQIQSFQIGVLLDRFCKQIKSLVSQTINWLRVYHQGFLIIRGFKDKELPCPGGLKTPQFSYVIHDVKYLNKFKFKTGYPNFKYSIQNLVTLVVYQIFKVISLAAILQHKWLITKLLFLKDSLSRRVTP